jgi:hypothetical protein
VELSLSLVDFINHSLSSHSRFSIGFDLIIQRRSIATSTVNALDDDLAFCFRHGCAIIQVQEIGLGEEGGP